MPKNQVYDYVTEHIVKALESGTIPWRKPCKSIPPTNFKSKKPYRGINYFLTSFQSYSSPYWLTFKQMTELGGKLKGEQDYTMVVYFNMLESKTKFKKNGDAEKFPMLKYYRVYNMEQIEGIEVPETTVVPFNSIQKSEETLMWMPNRPTINYGGDRAFYRPMTDEIQLPNKNDFASAEEFYGTAFHELGHATGHESRLKRFLKESPTHIFGSESYSREELIAEMTAAFVCAHCGINTTFDNSASYIQSWLKELKNDHTLIVKAANAAQKAADLIINKKEEEKTAE